jgi:hypothetical protein
MLPQVAAVHPVPEILHVTREPDKLPVRTGENDWLVPMATVTVSGTTPIVPCDDLVE